MRFSGWVAFFCLLGAVAIGAFIAIAITDISTIDAAWCDARPACLRDWIGALSGWAAAAGALAAALLTVPHLQSQAQEARKQTRFLIGDDDPSVELTATRSDFSSATLTITNWNRRQIVVEGILPEAGTDIFAMELQGDPDAHCRRIGSFQRTVLPGWIDRGKSPPQATYVLEVYEKRDPDSGELRRAKIAVAVKLRIVGTTHEHRTFPAEVPDLLTF